MLNKPNIVLLHGWGFNRMIWHDFVALLTPYFNVFDIDLPGYGACATQSIKQLDELVKHILADLPQQAVFVGWSLGGQIAMHIAQHHLERISHLITFCSNPHFLATDEWPGVRLFKLTQFAKTLQSDTQKTLHYFFKTQLLRCRLTHSMKDTILQRVLDHGSSDIEALALGLDILTQQDYRAVLKAYSKPQLHIFGHLDALVPSAAATSIADLNPNARIVMLDDAAHLPFITHPERCLTEILSHTEVAHAG